MENEELNAEQIDLQMQMQSAAVRSNPRLQAADTPEQMGPEQEIDPVRNTYTYDTQVNGQVFTSDYYTQIDNDYKAANETVDIPVLGAIVNPIANPAATVYREFMYGGNIAMNIGKEIHRKVTNGAPDPAWNDTAITEWLDKNSSSVPLDQRWRFYGTNNSAEAEELRADSDAAIQAMKINSMRGGFEQFTAGALAGLVDIDTPLVLLTGGLSAAAKAGVGASRLSRLLAGTASGAAMGTTLGAIDYGVNPVADPESIAMFAVLGAGFGLAGGSMAKHADVADGMRNNAAEELGRKMNAGEYPDRGAPERSMETQPAPEVQPDAEAPGRPAPDTFDPEQVEDAPDAFDPMIMQGGSSVGAKQAGQRVYDGLGRAGITNKESLQLYDDSRQWAASSPALRDYEDPTNMGNAALDPLVDRAVRFKQGVDAIGAGTDFDTFMRSGLKTAQRFAMMVMESASGIGRTQTNAAVIKDAYHRDLVKHIRPVKMAFKKWHNQEQGYKWNDWLTTPTGTGAWKSMDRFNEEVIKEQMARRFGGKGTTSKAAKEAADAVEAFYTAEYGIGVGNQGQTPLGGYDQFTRKPGYVTQQWSGRKLAQAVEDAGRVGGKAGADRKVKDLKDALHEEYVRLHGNMPILKPMADAVIDRALASRRGFKHDLIGLLRGDEGEFIRAALRRNGVREKEIDSVLDSIVGSRADKTRIGATQSRTDVDFRSVASNGIRMMDMLETDLDFLMASRANKTSGLAALARMGIPDRVTYEKWKKAILDEQDARGKRINSNSRVDGTGGIIQRQQRTAGDVADDFIDREPEITEELLDAVYGYYSGNRPNAGQYGDAVIQRIKKLTRLSLMNQLGLTSLAEHGAIAGTVGWNRWYQHMTQDLREAMGNPASELNAELKHFAFFESEESLFNGRLMYEMDKANSGELMQKLDSLLNKGLEIQGYLSGYHAVVGMQQRVAISSLTARIYGAFKTGKDGLSAQRMKDLGLDDTFMARTSKFAQYDADGNLVKLNMDQWDWQDVQLYQQIMSRGVNQLVQKAMAGEGNWAFSANGLAQLFMQFKSFPLLAVHKQFTRNMRMADTESINTFFFGLITAGAAYSARQVLNGNTENLTAEKIAKGALNYSNMAGWLPMFVDPVLNAAGADFDTSGYSSTGVGSVISLPASFGVMEKMIQLPFMPAKLGLAATGNYEVKNSDIRVIQSLPILGNAYGINALLNSFKEAPKRKPAEQPTVQEPPVKKEQPKEKEKAPVDDLEKAAALAVSKGWSDGYKYVEQNINDGQSIKDIIKALNEQ